MPRNPDSQRQWRSDPGRSNRWRDPNEGRYGSAADDSDIDYDFDVGGTRQGGYGGNFGRGEYGGGGSLSRFEVGEAGAATGLHRGKGPKGYQRSDERLHEMISEWLHDAPDIDASDVTVSVKDSVVTFEGTVDSRLTKNLIEDVAEQFGVMDVQNHLRVQKRD